LILISILNLQPITDWLLRFGFENWGRGSLYANEHEVYDRYVLHNVLDALQFEVHNVNEYAWGQTLSKVYYFM
jgi:hypothetical protein